MIALGLTGGIAMGKSTVLAQLKRLGARTESADTLVHRLMQGRAYAAIAKQFPSAAKNGAIDRAVLGDLVFQNPSKLQQLETIIHPMVRQEELRFLANARKRRARIAVIEIPLLFESKAASLFDYTLTVHTPAFLQKHRALSRPGMTPEKFVSILARQLPQRERLRRSDFVIHTGLGKAYTFRILKTLLKHLDTCAK